MSLVKSWREAKAVSDEPARKTTFWMLISQLAGGVLAILVLPLLRLAGIPPLWSTIFAGFAYAFALIMPYAFLAARGFGDAPGSTPHHHNPATPKKRPSHNSQNSQDKKERCESASRSSSPSSVPFSSR